MQPANPSDHARHEPALVAGHAAGDLDVADRRRADALLAACTECAELRRDLVAIAAATRSVPPPFTNARDFRLTAEQAGRLRRGSWLRAFLRPFSAARSPVRPMATAFTSLGFAGLLLGVALTGFQAGGGAVPAGGSGASQRDATLGAPALPAATVAANEFGGGRAPAVNPGAAPSNRLEVQQMASPERTALEDKAGGPAAATAGALVVGEPDDDDGRAVGGGEESNGAAVPGQTQQASLLIGGSLALIGIGLLLFGLRIASRRLG